jgi:signal transduction histidine kinase
MEIQPQIDIFIVIGILAMVCLSLGVIIIFIIYRSRVLQRDARLQADTFRITVDAQENERERIAKNLHDEVMPLITVLKQNIQLNRKALACAKLQVADIDNDADIAARIGKSIKDALYDLIPTALEKLGLVKALEQHFRQLNNSSRSVELENKTGLVEIPLTKPQQLNIYRVCTEIVNNLQKHDPFSYLKVTFNRAAGHLTIQFRHDGRGITNTDIEKFSKTSTGLGLASIKSRLLILGGSVNYSKEQHAACILVTIPLSL